LIYKKTVIFVSVLKSAEHQALGAVQSSSSAVTAPIISHWASWRTGGDHQDTLVLRGWRLSSKTWNQ